jgi:biotin carboxyl carrier protein
MFYVYAAQAGKIKEVLVEEGDYAEEDDELLEHLEME